MLKHFLQWLLVMGTMFAAGTPALGGGEDGAANTGAGAGAGGGTGAGAGDLWAAAGGGTPQNGGASPGQQGAQPGDGNIRQLREAYEGVKAKFEPFEKLNLKPEQITQFSGVYQKVYNEAASIGRELGYPDDQIAEALAEDPVRTLDFLRNEAQRASEGRERQDGQGQDLNALVQQQIEQAMGPIQQRENVRMTNEANSLFERTVHQEAVNLFKGLGLDVAQIPQDEMEMLMTATSEVMKYEEGDLRALKYEGKTAGVQKAFREAVNALDKYYLARSGRERAKLAPGNRGGTQAQPQGGQPRRPSLDEIIDNPGVINQKYA